MPDPIRIARILTRFGVGGVERHAAVHLTRFDAAVGGMSIHSSMNPGDLHRAVGGLQMGIAVDVFHAEGTVGALDGFEFGAPARFATSERLGCPFKIAGNGR